MKWTDKIEVFNEDCMATMSRYPDNYFDLAIVDPPYGINVHQNYGVGNRKDKNECNKKWDTQRPNKEYFNELKRVSKEQIIWGANYYNCFNDKGGAIIWNKKQPLPDSSQCEIASYSRLQKVGMYEQRWTNFVNTKKTNHPTEKPISLYQWIYKNYAENNFKIIDTHFGSGSHGIAVDSLNKIEKMNITLIASEIDQEYYNESLHRFKQYESQLQLF